MEEALAMARKGLGMTSPNPAVGAVIVRGGKIVARGYHAYAGADHAEVMALRALGFDAQGCDLYTTLEPCDHQGRTGPCTEAILRSGIRRVIVGAADPNPLVRGRGLRRLRRAGVAVTEGVLEPECRRLNEAFNFAIVQGRPFVVLKAALSWDGRIATSSGESRWISSKASRSEAHRLRSELDAVLVGVGTILADDPRLTARIPGGRDPVRIILDSSLRTPLSSEVVRTARTTRTIIATTSGPPARRKKALESLGVEVLEVAEDRASRVDLCALLEALHQRELNSILVEGGARVHGAFVDARLVNKVVLFLAPLVIGGERAPSVVGGRGARSLREALALERVDARPLGRDFVLTGYAKAGWIAPGPPKRPLSKKGLPGS